MNKIIIIRKKLKINFNMNNNWFYLISIETN